MRAFGDPMGVVGCRARVLVALGRTEQSHMSTNSTTFLGGTRDHRRTQPSSPVGSSPSGSGSKRQFLAGPSPTVTRPVVGRCRERPPCRSPTQLRAQARRTAARVRHSVGGTRRRSLEDYRQPISHIIRRFCESGPCWRNVTHPGGMSPSVSQAVGSANRPARRFDRESDLRIASHRGSSESHRREIGPSRLLRSTS